MRVNLKEARKRAGMTQTDLSEMLDISLRHYQRIEHGESNGSFYIWDTLEEILGESQKKLRLISNIDHGQTKSR